MIQQRFPLKSWRNLRLIAVDETGLRLPDFDWIGDQYDWHVNQHSTVASTRILLFFDVLNQIITNIELHPRELGELTVAYRLIPKFKDDTLAIYDRGYASYAVPFLHLLNGTHCIIRLPKTFGPQITELIQEDENERFISATLGDRPRNHRIMRINERHHYQHNYKSSM